MRYFNNFPKIDGQPDLSFVVRLRDFFLSDPKAFYPYVVQEGEMPDMIALDYYGSHDRTWLVLLSNDIIDFYSEWPLTSRQLDKKAIKDYGSLANAMSTIVAYRNDDVELTPESFGYEGGPNIVEYIPITAYERMIEENEAKRNIRLLDLIYAGQAEDELKRLAE